MKSLTVLISSLALFVVFAFGMTNSVFAEKTTDIYKWVDKDGRVHYAARPGDKSAEKMHLGSKIFHKRSKTEEDAAKTEEKNAERNKLCQESKDTMAKYKSAPFLYRYDEQRKQKVRLTEKESKEAFLQTEKDISYWCNPEQKSAAAEDEKAEKEN